MGKTKTNTFFKSTIYLRFAPTLRQACFVKTVTFAINKENNEDFINVVAEKDKLIYNFFFFYFSEVCIVYN